MESRNDEALIAKGVAVMAGCSDRSDVVVEMGARQWPAYLFEILDVGFENELTNLTVNDGARVGK